MEQNDYKYEAVFGDISQFDGMMPDCVFVSGEYGYKIVEDTVYYCERYNERYGWSRSCIILEDFKPIAMRRIIKTPVWTVADQKDGRLPEVGAKCRQGHKDEIVIAVTEKFVVTECQDMSVCTTRKDVFMRSYNPIETPAEKAQRERDEWAKKASEFIDDELDCVNLVGEHVMRRFYNAMLSGELPMPKKGGE